MAVSGAADKKKRRNKDQRSLGPISKTLLGTYFVLWSVLLAYLIFTFWPVFDPADPETGVIPPGMVSFFGYHFEVAADIRLILLVMVTGALGGHIHAARSFADYVGADQLYKSWVWWYLLQTFVGVSLALLFYFVIRGGFLSAGASAGDISPYGIAAVSGLVGMYSEQAAKKLKDIFEQLFTRPENRSDPLQPTDKIATAKPGIGALNPETVAAGSTGILLTVDGNDFVPESVVQFDGEAQQTEYVSSTKLTVAVPDEKVASSTEIVVTVVNPTPGGGTSNERTWTVR